VGESWIVSNLNAALSTWNDKLAEIWSLLTESPQTFKGGQVWGVMTGIHGALQAISYGLLVLFFAVGVMKTCGSFVDVKFHLRTRADMPLLRTEYRTCNKHLLLTERNG
jgi:hypothetical protein